MKRIQQLAAAFDRRLSYAPVSLRQRHEEQAGYRPPVDETRTAKFLAGIRADYTWLSVEEIAARRKVSLSTAKRWVWAAFNGRP